MVNLITNGRTDSWYQEEAGGATQTLEIYWLLTLENQLEYQLSHLYDYSLY